MAEGERGVAKLWSERQLQRVEQLCKLCLRGDICLGREQKVREMELHEVYM